MRTSSFQILTLVAAVAAATSCGDVARQGKSPMQLVVNSLTAAPSGGPLKGQQSGTLLSDVITFVTTPAPCTPASPCPTIFNDMASAVLSGQTKNPTVAPTDVNAITINRVHIEYVRADGRNTPGVDVPYAFDGAVTGTVFPGTPATLSFEIVRHVSKEESPLVQLETSNNIITTICNVTFYGTDAAGNEVSVTGSIQIDFGNFADQ